jgi:hypothetical protein
MAVSVSSLLTPNSMNKFFTIAVTGSLFNLIGVCYLIHVQDDIWRETLFFLPLSWLLTAGFVGLRVSRQVGLYIALPALLGLLWVCRTMGHKQRSGSEVPTTPFSE